MASDGFVRLSRLLLQQSDRHPVRSLPGDLLADHDPGAVRAFIDRGLLVRTQMRSSEDCVVHRDEDGVWLATRTEELEVERLEPGQADIFEIDFRQMCRCMREGAGLAGAPCEEIGRKTVFLGARGKGPRRRQVYLVRALVPDQALEILLAVRAHAGHDGGVVVLTPTRRELPKSVHRQLDDLPILAVADLLRAGAVPFEIRLPATPLNKPSTGGSIRLAVDVGGRAATLDGKNVRVQPRDFATLQILVVEAHEMGGFVARDQIGEALRDSTGRDGNQEQIDKSINRLRDAFEEVSPAGRALIETKPKVGYRLRLRKHEIGVN
jgi:DNA-binding response OmpR family regulator